MADFWMEKWQEAENARVRNNFTIGILCGALQEKGLTPEQLGKLLDYADKEGTRIYGKV